MVDHEMNIGLNCLIMFTMAKPTRKHAEPNDIYAIIRMPKVASSHAATGALCLALALLACLGNALYALGAPDSALKFWSPGLVTVAMIAFLAVHGIRTYHRQAVLVFVVFISGVGWIFESIGISTGFPFGAYHYASDMSPFAGNVPVFVLSAYVLMGYVSWALAALIARPLSGRASKADWLIVPLLAAGLMVVWDLSMDPLRATVEGRWTWIDGGDHYGVPDSNYVGWFMVTWLMFQAFAWYLKRRGTTARHPDRLMALSVPIMYAAFAVEYVANPFLATGHLGHVTVGGAAVPVADIFSGIAVQSALTILPIATLGAAVAGFARYNPRPQHRVASNDGHGQHEI